MSDLHPLIEKAIDYAIDVHKDQVRDDGLPYITHLQRVTGVLHQVTREPQIIAAGWLHDVLEDSDATFEGLKKRFGSEVAQLVFEVTKDDSGAFTNLKSRDAILIKFADRLCNLADMRGWDDARQSDYIKLSNFWHNY